MRANGGTLYVVATPLGNLADLSPRALEILSSVDIIAAEDTRHSASLLRHYAITTPCIALHEHNERAACAALLARLQGGAAVALISDAGTPLISDPGFHLVREARALGLAVSPIPGGCAAIAALSAAGLPSDRFVFEGFLPAKAGARRAHLDTLRHETRTLIFYEAPHRALETLQDMRDAFGMERPAVLAREITKVFETFLCLTLGTLVERVASDANQQRGECVILVAGAPDLPTTQQAEEGERVLRILLEALPVKQAAALAARITGEKKNVLYQRGLELRGK